jgi:hypothetical protein
MGLLRLPPQFPASHYLPFTSSIIFNELVPHVPTSGSGMRNRGVTQNPLNPIFRTNQKARCLFLSLWFKTIYTRVLNIALTIPFPFPAQVRRALKSACLAKLADAKQSRLARGHGSGIGITVRTVEWESMRWHSTRPTGTRQGEIFALCFKSSYGIQKDKLHDNIHSYRAKRE